MRFLQLVNSSGISQAIDCVSGEEKIEVSVSRQSLLFSTLYRTLEEESARFSSPTVGGC
jgi:hypothetical protein